MGDFLKALYSIGLILSAVVGIWHFSVPYLYQWYLYIPDEYKVLNVGINYINFFFSLLLTGYSLLFLLFRRKIFSGNKELLIMYGFMVFVWFCRVAITFIIPWPLEPVVWPAYAQQIASFIIFILQLIPFFYLLHTFARRHKIMNKITVTLAIMALVCIGNLFADNNVTATLDITGININDGKIYVKIYSNEKDYKKDIPYISFVLESVSKNITCSFDVPEGEYLIALFQDTNNNGLLDTNFLNVPKEPVGLSNYNGGIPGGFNKQKIQLNAIAKRITINMGRV